VFSRGYPPRRGSRTPPTASPRDIVGLIWRSGINQRANILRGPGNAAGARRRSFYRRRKTIRIYIRAREERMRQWAALVLRARGRAERAREARRSFSPGARFFRRSIRAPPYHPALSSRIARRGSRKSIWHGLLERRPRRRSNYRSFARRLLRMHLAEARLALLSLSSLLLSFSPRSPARCNSPQAVPSLSVSRCIACERRKCAVNAFGQCGLRKLTIECEIVVRVSYDLAATPVHSAPFFPRAVASYL